MNLDKSKHRLARALTLLRGASGLLLVLPLLATLAASGGGHPAPRRPLRRCWRTGALALVFLGLFAAVGLSGVASTAVEAQSGSLQTDRQLLSGLYLVLGGSKWTNDDNWLEDKPLDQWYGVSTDSQGRVTGLDLSGNGLTGTIPPGLNVLFDPSAFDIRLKDLDLSDNQLSGVLPTGFIPLFPHLEVLKASGNQFSGPIPSDVPSLSKLTWLDLDDNDFSGRIPSGLGRLSDLTVLRLGGNELSGPIPSALGSLSKLDILGLGNNRLNGEIPSALGRLSNLTRFSVWNNELSGQIPPELGNLSSLTKLNLGSNKFRGPIPKELAQLVKLDELSLSANPGLTGCVPPELLKVAKNDLAKLSLPTCGAEPQEPPDPDRAVLSGLYVALRGANWARNDNWLEEDVPLDQWYGVTTDSEGRVIGLDLSNNGLSGSLPTRFGSLLGISDPELRLEVLNFSDNQIAGPIPTTFINFVPDLTTLDLSRNHLIGEIPAELGNLANLQILFLPGNQLTGEIPPELGNLDNLAFLELRDNQLTGKIPTQLGKAANLTFLYLSNNRLTGGLPSELGNLANLRFLYVSDNQLSGELPASLGNLSNLTGLDIRNSQLSGCVPTPLREQLDFGYSDLGGLPFCDAETEELPDTDRTVLSGLYTALGGPRWDRKDNWLGDAPIRFWYGVTTDSDGRLTGLDLSNNGLSGRLPTRFGSLLNVSDSDLRLEELDLSGNQLTGPIPPTLISLFPNLTKLDLSGNQLSGEIPAELGNLAKLTSLDLSDNELFGEIPSHLSSLDGLAECEEIGERALTRDALEDFSKFAGGMVSLQELDLSDNTLSGEIPPMLCSLTILEVLDLGHNRLTGTIPVELSKLANLQVLRLQGQSPFNKHQYSGQDYEERLANCGNDCYLHGEIPASLTDLTSLLALWLHDNRFSGCIPLGLKDVVATFIGELPEFCPLPEHPEERAALVAFFRGTKGGGDAGKLLALYCELGDNLRDRNDVKLREHNDDDCNWREETSGSGLSIGEWWIEKADGAGWADGSFESGGVTFNEFILDNSGWTRRDNWSIPGRSDIPVALWEGVTVDPVTGHVIELDLSGNNLRGNIPPVLSDLGELEHLNLAFNNLSGNIPKELSDLRELKDMNLSSNHLTGRIPWQLGWMLPREEDGYGGSLENLYLFDNELSGCIPHGLIDVLERGLNTAEEALNRYDESPLVFGVSEGMRFVDSDWFPKKSGNVALTGLSWWLVYRDWVRPTYGLWLPPCAPSPPDLPLEFKVTRDGEESYIRYAEESYFTDRFALRAIRDHFIDAGSKAGEFKDWTDGNISFPFTTGEGCGLGKWHGVNTYGTEVQDTTTGLHGLTTVDCRVTELSLDKRELRGTIPKEIGHLSKLRKLNLSQNCLTGPIPAELGHLWRLENLSLNVQGKDGVGADVDECESDASLSGELPPEIGNLRYLKRLQLFDNPGLTGTLPPEFGNLEDLEYLTLENTEISGCLPPSIVGNFTDPAATGFISPILGIGAGLALAKVTGGIGSFVGYWLGVAVGEVVGRVTGAILDPIIKPGAEHWLPFIGSELHNVNPLCN